MMRAFLRDLALAAYLRRRASKQKATLCRRKSDGTLWAASSPQDIGYAMRGLFSKAPGWHFARVRIWRGLPIVAPRVFWCFDQWGQFDILPVRSAYWLKRWPYDVEGRKIDEHMMRAGER